MSRAWERFWCARCGVSYPTVIPGRPVWHSVIFHREYGGCDLRRLRAAGTIGAQWNPAPSDASETSGDRT
jgi:hypothetical protein